MSNKESSKSASDNGSDSRAESSVSQPERAGGDDLVRLRAYELYLQRGDKPGDDLGDWLRAEREYAQ